MKIAWFDNPFVLITTGGRKDLVFPFSAAYWAEDGSQSGRLACWRINFGDCSWISDYKVNYAAHHNSHPLVATVPPVPPLKESGGAKVRPIARMAPMGYVKVKKTAGKKPIQPTRRSTVQERSLLVIAEK